MLVFRTTKPQLLLDAFTTAIGNGSIADWQHDGEGDFTIAEAAWRNRAWLRPRVKTGRALKFTILFAKKEREQRLIYSIYHGLMIETFFHHLLTDTPVTVEATSCPSGTDSPIRELEALFD